MAVSDGLPPLCNHQKGSEIVKDVSFFLLNQKKRIKVGGAHALPVFVQLQESGLFFIFDEIYPVVVFTVKFV